MPYAYENKGFKLGREHSRRCKVKDRDLPKLMWLSGCSIRSIARHFGVDKRAIQYILFPERLERSRDLLAARGGSKHYYVGGAKWAKIMREHRAYKAGIYRKLQGGKSI